MIELAAKFFKYLKPSIIFLLLVSSQSSPIDSKEVSNPLNKIKENNSVMDPDSLSKRFNPVSSSSPPDLLTFPSEMEQLKAKSDELTVAIRNDDFKKVKKIIEKLKKILPQKDRSELLNMFFNESEFNKLTLWEWAIMLGNYKIIKFLFDFIQSYHLNVFENYNHAIIINKEYFKEFDYPWLKEMVSHYIVGTHDALLLAAAFGHQDVFRFLFEAYIADPVNKEHIQARIVDCIKVGLETGAFAVTIPIIQKAGYVVTPLLYQALHTTLKEKDLFSIQSLVILTRSLQTDIVSFRFGRENLPSAVQLAIRFGRPNFLKELSGFIPDLFKNKNFAVEVSLLINHLNLESNVESMKNQITVLKTLFESGYDFRKSDTGSQPLTALYIVIANPQKQKLLEEMVPKLVEQVHVSLEKMKKELDEKYPSNEQPKQKPKPVKQKKHPTEKKNSTIPDSGFYYHVAAPLGVLLSIGTLGAIVIGLNALKNCHRKETHQPEENLNFKTRRKKTKPQTVVKSTDIKTDVTTKIQDFKDGPVTQPVEYSPDRKDDKERPPISFVSLEKDPQASAPLSPQTKETIIRERKKGKSKTNKYEQIVATLSAKQQERKKAKELKEKKTHLAELHGKREQFKSSVAEATTSPIPIPTPSSTVLITYTTSSTIKAVPKENYNASKSEAWPSKQDQTKSSTSKQTKTDNLKISDTKHTMFAKKEEKNIIPLTEYLDRMLTHYILLQHTLSHLQEIVMSKKANAYDFFVNYYALEFFSLGIVGALNKYKLRGGESKDITTVATIDVRNAAIHRQWEIHDAKSNKAYFEARIKTAFTYLQNFPKTFQGMHKRYSTQNAFTNAQRREFLSHTGIHISEFFDLKYKLPTMDSFTLTNTASYQLDYTTHSKVNENKFTLADKKNAIETFYKPLIHEIAKRLHSKQQFKFHLTSANEILDARYVEFAALAMLAVVCGELAKGFHNPDKFEFYCKHIRDAVVHQGVQFDDVITDNKVAVKYKGKELGTLYNALITLGTLVLNKYPSVDLSDFVIPESALECENNTEVANVKNPTP